jgi:hypothetical protein
LNEWKEMKRRKRETESIAQEDDEMNSFPSGRLLREEYKKRMNEREEEMRKPFLALLPLSLMSSGAVTAPSDAINTTKTTAATTTFLPYMTQYIDCSQRSFPDLLSHTESALAHTMTHSLDQNQKGPCRSDQQEEQRVCVIVAGMREKKPEHSTKS